MKKVLWQEMRRDEFEAIIERDGIAIIPVGSTEQHGEHLPINTDTNCCFAIAVEAAEIGNEIGAADVLEAAVRELRAVRFENVKPAVRQAGEGTADVVAADANVQPAVSVHVGDGTLAVVTLFILHTHRF